MLYSNYPPIQNVNKYVLLIRSFKPFLNMIEKKHSALYTPLVLRSRLYSVMPYHHCIMTWTTCEAHFILCVFRHLYEMKWYCCARELNISCLQLLKKQFYANNTNLMCKHSGVSDDKHLFLVTLFAWSLPYICLSLYINNVVHISIFRN